MIAPTNPARCSECGGAAYPRAGAGRPRHTCGPKCAGARRARLKREDRAIRAAQKAADEANATYLRAEAAFFKGVGR